MKFAISRFMLSESFLELSMTCLRRQGVHGPEVRWPIKDSTFNNNFHEHCKRKALKIEYYTATKQCKPAHFTPI